ncbi:MAG: AI-2E family transporter [Rubricoccaceae bacterium]
MSAALRLIETRTFMLLLVLVTVAFLWVIGSFLMPVFWAVVLAVLFRPVQRRLRLVMPDSLAAVLTLLLVLVVVIVPLLAIGAAVTREALGLYAAVQSGQVDLAAPIRAIESRMPEMTQRADEYGIDLARVQQSIEEFALTAAQTTATLVLNAGQQVLRFLLLLVVALYVLFFFLRDGERIVSNVVRAVPLGDVRERRMFSRFAAITRATIKGTFVIAAVQGGLGGLAFSVLGIGAPVLWGVVMGVLSLLPAVGPTLVWVPAAIYLFSIGSFWPALALVGFGTLVIGTIDNILRPILVGRDVQMADYMILLSTLGGIAVLGVSGIVIGPVIAGLFVTVWQMFTEEYGRDSPEHAEEVIEAAETPGVEGGAPPVEALPDPEEAAAPVRIVADEQGGDRPARATPAEARAPRDGPPVRDV